jgi:hypothetical protein
MGKRKSRKREVDRLNGHVMLLRYRDMGSQSPQDPGDELRLGHLGGG